MSSSALSAYTNGSLANPLTMSIIPTFGPQLQLDKVGHCSVNIDGACISSGQSIAASMLPSNSGFGTSGKFCVSNAVFFAPNVRYTGNNSGYASANNVNDLRSNYPYL